MRHAPDRSPASPSIRLKNQGKAYAEISACILRILRGEYLDRRGDYEV